MRPCLVLIAAAALSAGCDQIQQAIGEVTGDTTTTPATDGDGGGDRGGTSTIGAQPSNTTGGATGLLRRVAGGGGPDPGVSAAQCATLSDGGPVNGPDCVTAEIKCGETVVGHTRGGVNRYNTKFYEANYCWPGTRNHNGGDERVYMFDPAKSEQFQRGLSRMRVSAFFDTPCADLTFTKMVGSLGMCPTDSAKLCDSANPFNREVGTRNIVNMTVDEGEVYYFLVEGADDAEGAFSISLDCQG